MFTGSLVALVTPMKSDGRIDIGSMERLIDWHVEEGTAGIVVAGTTGESATMGESEHAEILIAAAEYAGDRFQLSPEPARIRHSRPSICRWRLATPGLRHT